MTPGRFHAETFAGSLLRLPGEVALHLVGVVGIGQLFHLDAHDDVVGYVRQSVSDVRDGLLSREALHGDGRMARAHIRGANDLVHARSVHP